MPHTVELRNERGELIRRIVDLGGVADAASGASAASCCLRFIDPYGDTVFNSLHSAVLAVEIDEFTKIRPASAVDSLRSISTMAMECAGRVHTYLWFIGD